MLTLTPNTQSPFPPYFPSWNAFFLGAVPSLPKVAALMAKINCCALNFPRLRCRRISTAQFLGSKEHLISNESPKNMVVFPPKKQFAGNGSTSFGNFHWEFCWEFSLGFFVPIIVFVGNFSLPLKHLTCPLNRNGDTNKAFKWMFR